MVKIIKDYDEHGGFRDYVCDDCEREADFYTVISARVYYLETELLKL